jgi:hypothetical protein
MTRMGLLKLVNFLLFQAGWLACVLGAARGLPWIAILYGVPALALHLRWARRAFLEFRLILVCVLTGLVFDSLLLASGWVAFPNGWWIPGAAPYWMLQQCLAPWAGPSPTLRANDWEESAWRRPFRPLFRSRWAGEPFCRF